MANRLVIDGMDRETMIADGLSGFPTADECDAAFKTVTPVIEHSVRAKEHIRIAKTIPAGGSVTEILRGIGNAGVITNLTVDNSSVQVAIDGVSLTMPAIPSGYFQSYQWGAANSLQPGDFPTTFRNARRILSLTYPASSASGCIKLDTDGSLYVAWYDTGVAYLRKYNEDESIAWTTVIAAYASVTVTDQLYINNDKIMFIRHGDLAQVYDKNSGLFLFAQATWGMFGTYLTHFGSTYIIGQKTDVTYKLGFWNANTGVYLGATTGDYNLQCLDVGGELYVNQLTTNKLFKISAPGSEVDLTVTVAPIAYANGCFLGVSRADGKLRYYDASWNILQTWDLPTGIASWPTDPCGTGNWINGSIAYVTGFTGAAYRLYKLNLTTGTISTTYAASTGFFYGDRNNNIFTIELVSGAPTYTGKITMYDGDFVQLWTNTSSKWWSGHRKEARGLPSGKRKIYLHNTNTIASTTGVWVIE